MTEGLLLDVLLVAFLVIYAVRGWIDGAGRSLGAVVGALLAGVGGYLLAGVVGPRIPDPAWRTATTGLLVVGILLAGYLLGAWVGGRIAGRDAEPHRASRVIGTLVHLVAGGLAVTMLAGALPTLGVPALIRASSGSVVLRALESLTPDPVADALARARTQLLAAALPALDLVHPASRTGTAAPIDTGSPEIDRAAASVVRLSGIAAACSRTLNGSGVIVASDRVLTNAHVVAGLPDPIIETRDGQVLVGRVVYTDPGQDLAVIAAEGLAPAPIPLARGLSVGDPGVVQGYPYGGPLAVGTAQVLGVAAAPLDRIDGAGQSDREFYTLAATIRPGNSGGPLLTPDGRLAGLVFATSRDDDAVGYALTPTALAPVIDRAALLTRTVEGTACRM